MNLAPDNLFERTTLFADIMLPVPIPLLFTYRVPQEFNDKLSPGMRVIVQFGAKKILTGVVAIIHEKPPKDYQAKYILDVPDEFPSINNIQLRLFQWMSSYYMCNIGEVLNAALPSGLKLSSQSFIQLNPETEIIEDLYSQREIELIQLLRGKEAISYDEAASVLSNKNIFKLLKSLIDKEAIILFEEVKEKYQPKIVRKLRLSASYLDKSNIEVLFKTLEKKPKQCDILLKYLQHIPVYNSPELNKSGLDRKIFAKPDFSITALNHLIATGVFEEFNEKLSRNPIIEDGNIAQITLSEEQLRVKTDITSQFEKLNTILLHGITGSGKTEIYIELAKEVLAQGYEVLYLLPEIALTTQIVTRLKKVFGNSLGVYHSRYSDNERVELWQQVNEGKIKIIVGARSAVFLPFHNLGLIIVDEEHESSFKQYEPAPRYHARDTAIYLAVLHHAKVLLGSATPSIESFHLAKTGKYGLATLNSRFGKAQLPDFLLADTKTDKKRNLLRSDFSPILLEKIEETLNKKEQAIIFQNRRGFSPFISCQDCGTVPKCKNCDVSLTYHQYQAELRCHYCGYREKHPPACVACGSIRLKTMGTGTEKIEEDLSIIFPNGKIQRLDTDSTRKKDSFQKIIRQFEMGETDILVGTQMLGKGLDFDKVSFVGIFDADGMINFPDFRSHERAFQLLSQVSGRAGRRDKKGLVVIQTNRPEQIFLKNIIESDYQSFFEREIKEREKFLYPPFSRIIKLSIKEKDRELTAKSAQFLFNNIIVKFGGKRVLGPESPPIDRIRGSYIKNILIKIERNKINLHSAKEIIRNEVMKVQTHKDFKKVQIIIDIDPV